MLSRILFIFEGPKLENNISASLVRYFVNDHTIITCAYCTTIYKLYAAIEEDEDLDTFILLKEIDANKEKLKDYKRSDFSQIYMFFDYDGHVSNADDKKIEALLRFFNEETEKGKLYLSYPMAEAIKHIESFESFEELKVPCKKDIDYKKIVRQKGLIDLKQIIHYDERTWTLLIDCHLKKANKIVNNSFSYPLELIDQDTIFKNQLAKYISIDNTVGVLSGFPLFLHDYYGNELIKKLIEHSSLK